MLTKRIIACMDVRDGQVVKGVQFQQLRHAGDPAALARRYNVEGIDEVVVLDITATLEKPAGAGADDRRRRARDLSAADRRRRHPLRRRCGGGRRCRGRQGQPQHRGAAQPRADHHAGPALRQPGGDRRDRREARAASGVRRLRAQRHGRRRARRRRVGARGRVARRRRDPADVDGPRRHARRLRLRADRRGRRRRRTSRSSPRAAPAASSTSPTSSRRGHADAALAASIFHYADTGVADVKRYLHDAGIPVRL